MNPFYAAGIKGVCSIPKGDMMTSGEFIDAVTNEAARAGAIHAPMHSPHEALGVIREEYAEFEQRVYQHNPVKGRDCRPQMREELIQLAAMCLRAIRDLDL